MFIMFILQGDSLESREILVWVWILGFQSVQYWSNTSGSSVYDKITETYASFFHDTLVAYGSLWCIEKIHNECIEEGREKSRLHPCARIACRLRRTVLLSGSSAKNLASYRLLVEICWNEIRAIYRNFMCRMPKMCPKYRPGISIDSGN